MNELITATRKRWPEEILVEPSRLEMGIWGRTEGDIRAAYSADKLPKVKTFIHGGHRFTNCGGHSGHSTNCYALIPKAEYAGPEPRRYTYEGQRVTYKGQTFRLGPTVLFTARPRKPEEWANLLRRQYAHGGYFASGKTYYEVLRYFQDRPTLPEDERRAIEHELTFPGPPATQAAMLEFLKSGTATTEAAQLDLGF